MKPIPLFKVFMPKSVQKPLIRTLFSGYIGHGQRVKEFEKLLGKCLKTNQVMAVNSGTSALQLAVKLAGVGPGDEVITTPLTFVATNWAILANGGIPVWADIDEETANIDWQTIEALITQKTKAIMVVHFGGLPNDMDEINAIAKKHKLEVIEDCSHAFGATYKRRPIGTIGDFGAFSFGPVKYLGNADGGLLVVKNPKKFKRAKLLCWYGAGRDNRKKSNIENDITEWGYKFIMNDLAATIGIEQLKYIDKITKKHKTNAEFYNHNLKNVTGVNLLKTKNDRESSCWLYTIKVERRGDFVRKMQKHGIAVGHLHDRNDEHSVVADFRRPLPQLDRLNKEIINIPVGWWLTVKDRKHIVDSIKNGW